MRKNKTRLNKFSAGTILLLVSTAGISQTFNSCPTYTMDDVRKWNSEGVVSVEDLIRLPDSLLATIQHEQKCRFQFMEEQKERLSKEKKSNGNHSN